MEDHRSGQRDLLGRRSLFVCYISDFSLGDFEQTRLQCRQSLLRHLEAEYLFYDAVLFLEKGEKSDINEIRTFLLLDVGFDS